ncbi:MAG TPA: hypothetical protein PLM07_08375 [Candidatus Rifleibacterium sp.]|nr:hypothetical protein [Candidatus Rifleibacterium sp.]
MNKKLLTPILLCLAAVAMVVFGQDAESLRNLPAGATGHTEIVSVTASEPLIIPAIWNSSSITVLQAKGTTDTFRAAIGTTTVDASLPEFSNFSVSFKTGGFIALQAGTDTISLVVYQVKQ